MILSRVITTPRVIRALGLGLALHLGGPVAAAERLSAAYQVTWLGIEVGAFEAELALDDASYRLAYQARTTGFLGWLFPFSSEGWSEGGRGEVGVQPARYEGGSQWQEDGTSWLVEFTPDGRVERIDIPAEQLAERDPVPAALQVGPDPLALIIQAIEAAAPGVERSGTTFDGRRALRLELACGDHVAMPEAAARWGASALVCAIDGELVAGEHRRWRDRERPEREPTKVWLSAELRDDRLWPVLAEVDTRHGTVTAELISFGTRSLAAAQP